MLSAVTTTILAATEGGAEAAEGGGSFLVEPGVGLMVWTLVIFGVAMALLYKLAFPAIAEALDKRQKLIEDSIESADRTKAEANQLLEEYRQRLADARVQADDIVARAQKAGEEEKRSLVESGRAEREEKVAQAQKDIEQEQLRALQEVRKEVAAMTVLATEKVTRKTLTEEDQRRLVEEALSELDFSALGGERNS
ncbi:F0F1 ATP synthase subunit B [Conexibacter sp. W3-3-2]|uniref:ATP synthase subunit b n=1 Tax=Paraconexibacter algicola TaxID=2133960 RepID=A0A2T4UMR8_9ACTN|nr:MULTISPECIES: F0F1 ATP synthase subunit B [Solirubrobacterales]MTD44140.1 F0F1 ATP synthase subunit B [Conexibacter sp. W3-3-2]PTL60533.1 ATP synthase F0 subunit B [Paraconexibacter algicola]